MKKHKFSFPSFVIECDPSLVEVIPKKEEHRKEFAKSSTILQLHYLLSRRDDLVGAVMVQQAIEGHEKNVLDAICGLGRDFDDKLKELQRTIDKLPALAEIECKVNEKLRQLKDEGVINPVLLATEIAKELNDEYKLHRLNDLCETLGKAYGGDGRVTRAIQNIERLLDETKRIGDLVEGAPTEEKIAEAVVEREKECFGQLRERLSELIEAVRTVQNEVIRKSEKIQAIIEAGEQEFEREAIAFLREEYGSTGRYQIIDKRTKEGATGRKTGDIVMKRNGTHNYKITIDWKKTNPKSPRRMPLNEAEEVAKSALKNRKADASIVCVQSPEQLPLEANGIYRINDREILTHFGLLRLAVELLEMIMDFERQNELEGDIDSRRVEEVIERLTSGDPLLETTIRSLRKMEGAVKKNISRLIDYQQQVVNRAVNELKILKTKTVPDHKPL